MGKVVNATPQPLYPQERQPVFTIQENERTPWSDWKGAENIAPTRIRTPDCQARSESLYRRRYPGPPAVTCRRIRWAKIKGEGSRRSERNFFEEKIHQSSQILLHHPGLSPFFVSKRGHSVFSNKAC
jgi:hypothetical protein